MKTLVTILIFLKSIISVDAQEIQKGEYYPNSENKKFEGTWTFINGSTTFKVVLMSKKTFIEEMGIFTDCLVGKYYLKNDGLEVADYLNSNETPISFGVASKNKSSILNANFNDIRKNKIGALELELLSNKVQKLKWKLLNTEDVRINGKGKDKDFSVPINIILSKA